MVNVDCILVELTLGADGSPIIGFPGNRAPTEDELAFAAQWVQVAVERAIAAGVRPAP